MGFIPLHFLPFISNRSARLCVDKVWRYSLNIPAQPDGGEVTPAQLPDHMVSAVEKVPYLDGMVSSCGTEKDDTVH